MTPERYREADATGKLTDAEVAAGHRFCCEWDGLLIYHEDPEAHCCSCLRESGFPPPKMPEVRDDAPIF